MRKISKLSLVAALAVAGFSTANAKPLEEAIKDVDVSGSVVYRYNDYNNKALDNPLDDASGKKGSDVNNNYKVGLNLSSKVNDFAKFNSRFLVSGANSGFAKLDAQKDGDANPSVTLSHAYFGLTSIKNTTINVGKQGLTTPWTTAIDPAGNDYTGTGALALSTWGPVTFAAGYFNQTNLHLATDAKLISIDTTTLVNPDPKFKDVYKENPVSDTLNGAKDIAVLAAIGKFGPIDVDLWYADMQHLLDTYTVGVSGNFGSKASNFGFDARYVNLSKKENTLDLATGKNKKVDDDTLTKLTLTGKVNIINAKIAYGVTGKKNYTKDGFTGGLTAFDNSAKTTMEGWNTTINGKRDAKYLQTTLGVDIINDLNLSVNYNSINYKTPDLDPTENGYEIKLEEKELYGQLTYKMSKNLSTYIRYGTYKNNIKDNDKVKIYDDKRGRLQVAYTF